MIKVNSKVHLNFGKIKELNQAQIMALEQTAEHLHTEVVQAQVMPFDTGNLQDESTFVDASESKAGKVTLVSSTPYARRLYFHPEYHFRQEAWKDEKGRWHDANPYAGGEWYKDWLPGGSEEDTCKNAFKRIYKRITGV